MTSLSHRVYALIDAALRSNELVDLPQTGKGLAGAPKSLFEYLVMNDRPEIRAQEVLFLYLQAAGVDVHREHGARVKGVRRIFDFVVREPASVGTALRGFGDCVIVELKHYSPHQTGQFRALLGPLKTKAGRKLPSLHLDYKKHRPEEAPLLQVGLFTAVEDMRGQATERPVWQASGSPFVRKYVKGKSLADYETAAHAALQAWELNDQYVRPAGASTDLGYHKGPQTSFTSPSGVEITGRVNYFLGIAP
jgi:hypothetical protein